VDSGWPKEPCIQVSFWHLLGENFPKLWGNFPQTLEIPPISEVCMMAFWLLNPNTICRLVSWLQCSLLLFVLVNTATEQVDYCCVLQTIYDSYFIGFYNVFFTSMPCMMMAIFEQVSWSSFEAFRAAFLGCIAALPRCGCCYGQRSLLCRSVCRSQPWTCKTQRIRSRCYLMYGLRLAQGTMYSGFI